jgi:SAM-dependent methyltransferase
MQNAEKPIHRSIESFGAQWRRFSFLGDATCGPSADGWFRQWIGTFDPMLIRGARVAEVGAGVGRSLFNMAKFEPAEIIGYEPSTCFEFLQMNMRDVPNCRLVNAGGHQFNERNLDYVFSIGVIHHIPDPVPVVRNVYNSLKSGGKFVLWVYGDQLSWYVRAQKLIRPVTNRINDRILELISWGTAVLLTAYGSAVLRLNVRKAPFFQYLSTTFHALPLEFKKIVIFDQLNPGWSDYYSESTLAAVLSAGGFDDIKIEEKDGYSWTAICTKD